MKKNRKWWEKKWYWALAIVLGLVLPPATTLFFFPEVPLSGVIIQGVFASLAVFFAYLAVSRRVGEKTFKKRFNARIVRKMRRTACIFGGAVFGLMIWFLVVIRLALDFNIPAGIVILLLFVLMVAWAFILDTIMKRRDYRPFM